jgi:uncharacterized metal-binding protein
MKLTFPERDVHVVLIHFGKQKRMKKDILKKDILKKATLKKPRPMLA